MDRGETEELTATGAGFPFRDLLAILKAGIKDVDGAAEDASAAKVVAAGAGATE